jgi:predicted transcriptional regulator of viral defense system
MAPKTALELLNRLMAAGRSAFTTAEASKALRLSPSSTTNLLTRLVSDGLVDRVARGHYVIRPIGRMGTSAAAEEVALAVGAVFSTRPHRIAYRSALAHHGLILHPTRVVQVACSDLVRIGQLSGRQLQVVGESSDTVDIGAIDAGHGARVSDLERSFLDSGRRVELVGGLDVIAHAIEAGAADLNVGRLVDQAGEVRASAALRRLASVARVVGLENLAAGLLARDEVPATPVPADPAEPRPAAWIDLEAGVVWSSTALDTVRRG